MQQERRRGAPGSRGSLRAELNDDQRTTLVELERFGWELHFLRRPLFQPSVAFLYDRDRRSYAVLEEDGTLNESHGHAIRPH